MADVGAEEVEDVCTTQDASKVTLPCWDTAEVDPAVDFEGVTAVFGYGSLVRECFHHAPPNACNNVVDMANTSLHGPTHTLHARSGCLHCDRMLLGTTHRLFSL